jgi:hypothetical protein
MSSTTAGWILGERRTNDETAQERLVMVWWRLVAVSWRTHNCVVMEKMKKKKILDRWFVNCDSPVWFFFGSRWRWIINPTNHVRWNANNFFFFFLLRKNKFYKK